MITNYFRTIKDKELKTIPNMRNGVWIHAEKPNDGELSELWEKLNLDETILEDAQDFFEVPRVEKVDGVTYFFTRYPYNDQAEDVETASLLIVMGETFVLTVTHREIPQFDVFLNGKVLVHTTQKTKFFIQIMQEVTDSFERQLVRLRRAVHKDRARLRSISNQEIVRFVNYEHKLNDMTAAVLPTNVSLQQVISGGYMQVYKEDKELVDDVRIDNAQVVESARILLKTIQNVRNASEAILANNLNNRIKALTVLTILLTIPTIISSLYGMNVDLPMQNESYAFGFVIAVVIAIVAIVVWYFKKNDWF